MCREHCVELTKLSWALSRAKTLRERGNLSRPQIAFAGKAIDHIAGCLAPRLADALRRNLSDAGAAVLGFGRVCQARSDWVRGVLGSRRRRAGGDRGKGEQQNKSTHHDAPDTPRSELICGNESSAYICRRDALR